MHSTALHKLLATLLLALAAFVPGIGAAQSDAIRWTDIPLVDGRVIKASELNGRPVVVQYWASWCPFCMKQNPHIEKLHRAQSGKGLVVLTFTLDRTDEAAVKYMNARGYTFPAARATPQSDQWFGKRRTLPEVYVVDATGRIVFQESGEMFEEDIAALARFAAK